MSESDTNNKLEEARARLEMALSSLAQGVALTGETLKGSEETGKENTVLKAHIQSLEQENLKLHEQVANFALKEDPTDTSGQDARIAELEEQKAALEQNYNMLKDRYSALQDDMEAAVATQPSGGNSDSANLSEENMRLRRELDAMKAERELLKADLDKAITSVETMLEDA